MKTKIPFYPQLAIRAWGEPDEHAESYELCTKNGFKVTPVDNTTIGTHPFRGRVRSMWNPDEQVTMHWTADGYFFGWTAPMRLDLELFKIENGKRRTINN